MGRGFCQPHIPLIFYQILEPFKGYQFTIEETSKDPVPLLLDATLPKTLVELKALLPGYDIQVDSNNPHLIHIIESSVRTESYPLTKVLDKFDYSGPAYMMLKQLPNMGPVIYGIIDGRVDDIYDSTEVKVSVKKASCLDIITQCMPLDHFGPILWIATLQPDNKVTVEFWPKEVRPRTLEEAMRDARKKKEGDGSKSAQP